MALSQIQCLDEHHVNWRMSESKPEFFYSEEQRRALEALISQGRDAFTDFLRENAIRDFLSEAEQEHIARAAEVYRPGHEHCPRPETPGHAGNTTPGSGEDGGDGEVSLQYWPDRSEASVAELDLGWPDAISYRGVTRVNVYTQPPAYAHAHIKEVVRKSIASAQKVIAVVMDAFTDVDIFRDLLDAGYRRKVPVYIIIDIAAVPCFLSMCGRADMHRGHLKNLRVRCCGGVEFFTRSAQKVCGSLSQKFVLIDGDRAISGSYSFTWSSSRLDRNLITVITGQTVETFDFQFRELFLLSRSVSLSKVPMVDEPVPDPLPKAAPVAVPTTVAKKLINPKYALVATSQTSSDQNSTNKNSQVPGALKIRSGRLKNVSEEPPIHPALENMEKAYLIPYLPTWPEPDPSSDVIGFINIRDEKRANQVHLQRSERFEVSQAIRFRAPLTSVNQDEGAASGQDTKAGENPTSGNSPAPPSDFQKDQPASTALNQDGTDATDSRSPVTQETHPAHTPAPKAAAEPLQADATGQATEIQPVPPVPKPRTLHLVIDRASSDQPDEKHITLIKIDKHVNADASFGDMSDRPLRHVRVTTMEEGGDSGSNGNGSLDSTKVMCDRVAADDPLSFSTASEEEFYDCSQQEPGDLLAERTSAGSGRGGQRLGDRINTMARLSQSMLDLRKAKQMEDGSSALIRQSQHLRKQGHLSPHRRTPLFQMSRSPGRDGRPRGPKVVIAKPGSYHRPQRAAGPVIGGHRYWQAHRMQPEPALAGPHARSGRSPQRPGLGFKKTAHTSSQSPSGPAHSKMSSLRLLKTRGTAVSQKKSSQNSKASR
ncbi:protein FAM83G [Nerophis ophidion]|uniref:protein FAM83G n=1 Tax=Nerophis ophidion TaxID=159077 RepID=UPI002AE04755|nr:protein FAM83G [Nerophis ophidion]XP_061736567.1 protein FAM83G [Nerophis ophidion]XP_061736568.1 protein FAM83G [Nerophis ophidion]